MISVSAGADVHHPSRTCCRSRAACSRCTRGRTSRRSCEWTTRSARSPPLRLLRRLPCRDLRRRIPDRYQQCRVVLRWPADGHDGLPAAGIHPGYVVSWILKKLNLLRAGRGGARGPRPGRVRAGLLSRVRAVPEIIIEPDGREVDGARYCSTRTGRPTGKPRPPLARERELDDVRRVPVRRVERGHR